ncbi:MAG: cation transporter [Spirochaetales bacterium]
MKKIVSIEGMTCNNCVAHVTKALSGVAGVTKVKVDLKKARAELESEAEDAALRAAVTDAGYDVTTIQTLRA